MQHEYDTITHCFNCHLQGHPGQLDAAKILLVHLFWTYVSSGNTQYYQQINK